MLLQVKEKNDEFEQEKILNDESRLIELFSKSRDEQKPIKLLLRFYKGHYLKLIFAAILYIVKSSPTWVLPIITANIVDIATTHPQNAVAKMMFNFALAALLLLQNIPTHMLYVRFKSVSSRSVEAGLRGAMIRKLQQLSITFHKEMASGKIQSKVMRDVESIEGFFSQIFETSLSVAVNMTVSLVVVITKSLPVFVMFLCCAPTAVIIRNAFSKSMQKRSRDFRKEIEKTSAAVYDMEELIPVTRAHALENKEVSKLTGNLTEVARRGYKLDRVQSLFGAVSWVILSLFQVICLVFTGFLALKGKISVGDVVLYQSYFTMLMGYVSSIIGLLPTITRGRESIISIGEILSAYDVEENTSKQKISELRGEYEFKNVFFDYDDRTKVLNDFSLKVNKGETVALVGESGSGKSTIINLVIGFYSVSRGAVLIDGKNINNIDLHSYRKHISVVPQNSILFSGTVRENITYGKPNITEEELANVIKMARLEDVITKLPDGLETNVGEHGDKLSGGQRQRISIARAIIRKPSVIIFDEATSALDSVTEKEIQKAIDNLTRDSTTFIVAHRLSTIKNADKIVVLKNGKCVEYGTYDELVAKKGEFYRYKQMQS